MLAEKIYNGVYAGTEAGEQEEFLVSGKVEGLLGSVRGKAVSGDELEELLSGAAGIGMEHGFKAGMGFLLQVLLELAR